MQAAVSNDGEDARAEEDERASDQAQWILTPKGARFLADLRRVDAVMQDYGLGL